MRADNGGKWFMQAVYTQWSFYRMTDPQTYYKAYAVMEPFLSQEDHTSYIFPS